MCCAQRSRLPMLHSACTGTFTLCSACIAYIHNPIAHAAHTQKHTQTPRQKLQGLEGILGCSHEGVLPSHPTCLYTHTHKQHTRTIYNTDAAPEAAGFGAHPRLQPCGSSRLCAPQPGHPDAHGGQRRQQSAAASRGGCLCIQIVIWGRVAQSAGHPEFLTLTAANVDNKVQQLAEVGGVIHGPVPGQ